MRKIVVVFLFLGILSLGGSSELFAQLDGKGNAPDFTLSDINGIEHNLYSYLDSGKVVVIDFFAVWCGICQSNTPVLEDVFEKFGPEGSDKIVMLSLEADNATSDQRVAEFMSSFNATNPHINTTLNVAGLYQIPGFPIYYVVAPDRSYKSFPGTQMNLEEELAQAIEDSPGLREVENDARIISFSEPRGSYCHEPIIPSIRLQNYGKNTISELILEINIDDQLAYEHIVEQEIEPYEYLNLTLNPLDNISPGWHDFGINIGSVNTESDAEENNGLSQGYFLYLENGNEVEIRLTTDTYPAETYWQILEDGKIAAEGLDFDRSRTTFTDLVCLEEGQCYTLIVHDRFGDGLSEGGVEIFYKGEILASLDADSINGAYSEIEFCIVPGSSGVANVASNQSDIEVFPNPTRGDITLKFPENTTFPLDINLLNMVGQVIYTDHISDLTSKKTLNLSAFPNGIFFLRISEADQIITKKVLIQK